MSGGDIEAWGGLGIGDGGSGCIEGWMGTYGLEGFGGLF